MPLPWSDCPELFKDPGRGSILRQLIYHIPVPGTTIPGLVIYEGATEPLRTVTLSGSIERMNHEYGKNVTFAIAAALLAAALLNSPAPLNADSFSVEQQRELALSEGALDLAVSSDGRWTFVLTSAGSVAVYGVSGGLVQTIDVGKGYDTIEFSPAGTRLLLTGEGKRKLKVLSLSLIYELDYTGTPFKGPPDAPVTIAVFNDFQ